VRSVEFHPEAQDEFISAAQFYERQAEGLGLDFILTVQRRYERLVSGDSAPGGSGPWEHADRLALLPESVDRA
jgi:hypothetical protein